MSWQHFFGNVTLFFGLVWVAIGLPGQILKNYREKRSGTPITNIVLSFFVYITRICYSTTIKSHYLLIPDCFAVCLAIVILWQYFHYREKKP